MAGTIGTGYQSYQELALTPSAVPAGSVATETFSVSSNFRTQQAIKATPTTPDVGVAVIAASITAVAGGPGNTSTLKLTFFNYSNGSVTPTSQVYKILAL